MSQNAQKNQKIFVDYWPPQKKLWSYLEHSFLDHLLDDISSFYFVGFSRFFKEIILNIVIGNLSLILFNSILQFQELTISYNKNQFYSQRGSIIRLCSFTADKVYLWSHFFQSIPYDSRWGACFQYSLWPMNFFPWIFAFHWGT